MMLREMLDKLTLFKVISGFGAGSENGMLDASDREVAAERGEAHVASSLIKDAPENKAVASDFDDFLGPPPEPGRHKVVIDIDHPAFLVESSTPGHFHLYVDIPPAPDEAYFDFLRAAAKIGLIEDGYALVSIDRGHSDLRLPWVKKGEERSLDQQKQAAREARALEGPPPTSADSALSLSYLEGP